MGGPVPMKRGREGALATLICSFWLMGFCCLSRSRSGRLWTTGWCQGKSARRKFTGTTNFGLQAEER